MKTIGIFYGSSNGTTESVAKQIAEKLGVKSSDIHDVGQASPADFASYEVLLLGSSTWGMGDLQDDWYDFLPKIKKLDLSGKLVGLFGCGDSSSFSDTFCDAIGTIHNDLKATDANSSAAWILPATPTTIRLLSSMANSSVSPWMK